MHMSAAAAVQHHACDDVICCLLVKLKPSRNVAGCPPVDDLISIDDCICSWHQVKSVRRGLHKCAHEAQLDAMLLHKGILQQQNFESDRAALKLA